MMQLRKMTLDEFKTYLEASIQFQALENSKNLDINIEDAMTLAKVSCENLLPQGYETKNHFFYSAVESDSKKVIGSLWIGKRSQASKIYAFIFDIVLSPEVRGKGLGKQLLHLAETEIKKLGFNSVGLHVFGHNTIAINLYEKSGFRKTNIYMMKDLK